MALLLAASERDAIVNDVVPPPDLERKLRLRLSNGGRLKFPLTLGELDELQGWIAATANHTTNRRLGRTLDAVSQKIENLLVGYTDAEE